jgi:hypothetical protein
VTPAGGNSDTVILTVALVEGALFWSRTMSRERRAVGAPLKARVIPAAAKGDRTASQWASHSTSMPATGPPGRSRWGPTWSRFLDDRDLARGNALAKQFGRPVKSVEDSSRDCADGWAAMLECGDGAIGRQPPLISLVMRKVFRPSLEGSSPSVFSIMELMIRRSTGFGSLMLA